MNHGFFDDAWSVLVISLALGSCLVMCDLWNVSEDQVEFALIVVGLGSDFSKIYKNFAAN